ncbi:hypothetical protein OPQ81_009521 [Rhizoctonia solani]|nr:hypothetical protein OPQ81_009521 [Rhizoctonia solani]
MMQKDPHDTAGLKMVRGRIAKFGKFEIEVRGGGGPHWPLRITTSKPSSPLNHLHQLTCRYPSTSKRNSFYNARKPSFGCSGQVQYHMLLPGTYQSGLNGPSIAQGS